MDIIIDTHGESDLLTKDCLIDSDEEDDVEFEITGTQEADLFDKPEQFLANEKSSKTRRCNASKDIDLEEFEKEMGWTQPHKRLEATAANCERLQKEITSVDKILEKSIIKPGFERLESVPAYDQDLRRLKLKRRKERAKTKGSNWFNMKPPEMTPEVRNDLKVIQMRSVLDPKHFYKKNDLKVLPKYFQIGKVVDSPLDYYSNRLTKKERKTTIVDELMANAEFSKYNKRKYKEIIDEKKKLHYKAHRHARKLKGRK